MLLFFLFYRKGDYYRYLAEFSTGNGRKDAAEHSLIAYKNATDIAALELPPTHPIRLGLALNFSGKEFSIRTKIIDLQYFITKF